MALAYYLPLVSFINFGKFLGSMKIAIFSDLHDNDAYLDIFITYCRQHKIEKILCCGDITSKETLQLLNKIELPLYLIRGNAEMFEDSIFSSLKNITYLGRTGEIILENKKIGLCHEPTFINKMLEKKLDYIFYGHTHKPWIEKKANTHLINPGTLGGVFTPSTFAVWEMSKPLPELIRSDLI
jgi:putative phosphoesterase